MSCRYGNCAGLSLHAPDCHGHNYDDPSATLEDFDMPPRTRTKKTPTPAPVEEGTTVTEETPVKVRKPRTTNPLAAAASRYAKAKAVAGKADAKAAKVADVVAQQTAAHAELNAAREALDAAVNAVTGDVQAVTA